MAYRIRRSSERKYFDYGWLKTYHTFSFASYYDPEFMGFRDLRVINEDRVAPGCGFPLHKHQDMEIISLVLEGELAHRDSTGVESVLRANEVQSMSAGIGITHSEYNFSKDTLVHFLQIWIVPDSIGISPRYQQMKLPIEPSDAPVLIASRSGREHSLSIQQDVEIYYLQMEKGQNMEKSVPSDRYGWLQIMEGNLKLNEDTLYAGDGVAIDPSTHMRCEAIVSSRMLYFDLK